MAVIRMSVLVADVEEALLHFDVIKIYRSITGIDGSYSEITGPGTRPALVAGQSSYDYTDPAGDASYYYRSTYFNTGTGAESSMSDPQQGVTVTALEVITVEELKEFYLFGLDLTNDQGEEMSDAFYEHYIASAVEWMEQQLDVYLTPHTFEDEKHDYIPEDYRQYVWLQLDNSPVIGVTAVKLQLPGSLTVREYDPTWFRVQELSGHLQLMPGEGSVGTVFLGAYGTGLPMAFTNGRLVPEAFLVSYSAGFESGQIPANIKDMVGKRASLGPLNILGDLIVGAGIASYNLSIDGLSEGVNTTSSATNSGYGARVGQYVRELKEDLPALVRYWKGQRVSVV